MLKSMLSRMVYPCRVLLATIQLHSYRWGKRLVGHRFIDQFDVRTKGHLHFKTLGVETPDEVAEKLLGQYENVKRLATSCGVTFEWGQDTLRARYEDALFPIATKEELYILNELIEESVYMHQFPGPSVIMDIGMNAGFAAILFAQQPDTVVVGFEPFGPTYAIAEANIRQNHRIADKVKTFNYGLSDSDSETNWEYIPERRGSCGCFSLRGKQIKTARSHENVRLRRASDVVEEITHAYPNRTLIAKIDCEGSEYFIIPDLITSGKIKNIHLLMMEWHRLGDRQPESLVTQLISANFMVVCRGPMSHNIGMIYAFNTDYGTQKESSESHKPELVAC